MHVQTIQIDEADYREVVGEVKAGRVVYLPQFEGRAFLRMRADEPDEDVAMLAALDDGAELKVPAVWMCASTEGSVRFAEAD